MGYHPVGFAYEPDGAHGATWGGDELPEVEGAGELLYKINGEPTTCADAGDTGLDCYEPEFFFPQGVWGEKVYTAELTITQAVADASNGGVIYYFCHIHSKMSGKLIIQQADGTPYTNGLPELELYPPVYQDDVDKTCGTSGVSEYRFGGPKDCEKLPMRRPGRRQLWAVPSGRRLCHGAGHVQRDDPEPPRPHRHLHGADDPAPPQCHQHGQAAVEGRGSGTQAWRRSRRLGRRSAVWPPLGHHQRPEPPSPLLPQLLGSAEGRCDQARGEKGSDVPFG